MDDHVFISSYLDLYQKSLFQTNVTSQLISFKKKLIEIKDSTNKIMFAGNGASASISSHCAVDFTKQGGVRAINFNEAGLITCFANDYGYEDWVARAIGFYGNEGDIVVLISSSGKSPNVVSAAKFA